ncbi:MAG: hypothetical protein DMF54_06730 [Acidobacteria bacterium]|nr:MAG: hypothetical protein DMF54_06730 [Acidobacteriota bacterium]
MIGGRRLAAAVLGGLLWLALFSLLYSLGDEIGAWPKAPPGGFRDVDLFAGFAGAIALLVALVLPRRSTPRFG